MFSYEANDLGTNNSCLSMAWTEFRPRQSEGGGTVVMEVPGRDEGMGLNQAHLVVHVRAPPLNLIGSDMYR